MRWFKYKDKYMVYLCWYPLVRHRQHDSVLAIEITDKTMFVMECFDFIKPGEFNRLRAWLKQLENKMDEGYRKRGLIR